jgi:hypothetical protein
MSLTRFARACYLPRRIDILSVNQHAEVPAHKADIAAFADVVRGGWWGGRSSRSLQASVLVEARTCGHSMECSSWRCR